jgi:hypothetical protein
MRFSNLSAVATPLVFWLSALGPIYGHDEHERTQSMAQAVQVQEKPPAKAAAPIPRFPQIEQLVKMSDPNESLDEALGGKTLHGTPIWPRTPECFPAESRDVFWQMDKVPDGKTGELRPLNFDKNNNGRLDEVTPLKPNAGNERDPIRGRNTWILWSGGNEGFWNWLAQDGYGFMDFLVALDSRNRSSRFKQLGVINQPGFKANFDREKRVLGLYLDVPDVANGGAKFKPDPWDEKHQPPTQPADHRGFKLFEPGEPEKFQEVLTRLEEMGDGIDYQVYGYPSGVVGLRLFLNPDFFGNTTAAAQARLYWKSQVEDSASDQFYTNPRISAEPKLVRPFRVGMSCGFCHVGPHPLNPPKDPEAPDWENLSSIIGNQFWKPQPLFANRISSRSFIYHFLASQQPGTIDTSLISTDQINNSNTINAVFELNARVDRAKRNPTERQSDANLRLMNVEDQSPAMTNPSQITEQERQRHTARVLLDGADSIGAFGALARVYLNIGTYYEEWNTRTNPVIGFRPQRPFALETCQRNSVYWQVNEKYRSVYLAEFFTQEHKPVPGTSEPQKENAAASDRHNSTQAMRLRFAKDGRGAPSKVADDLLKIDTSEQRRHGRELWLTHCAVCHSSKQPEGFELTFSEKPPGESWESVKTSTPAKLTLPSNYSVRDWGDFKKSPAYLAYLEALQGLVHEQGKEITDNDPLTDNHPFWKDNYLSTDIRVPLTLVKTNPGRALGSNGIAGHVWDNFSSDGYKALPSIGVLEYNDVVNGQVGHFIAPGGGRGYYRPATHASLWSTAPFLHNNALGLYLDDPSVKGRLVQFLDSIRRLLSPANRSQRGLVLSEAEVAWLKNSADSDSDRNFKPDAIVTRPGDLRATDTRIAGNDPGYVYRVPQDSYFEIPSGHVKRLISGVAGPLVTSILEFWGWIAAVALLLFLAWYNRIRYVGVGFLLAAVTLLALWLQIRVGGSSKATATMILMGIMDLLRLSPLVWFALIVGLASYGSLLIFANHGGEWKARWLILLGGVALLLLVYALGWMFPIVAIIGIILILIGWIWNPTLAKLTRVMVLGLSIILGLAGYGANRFINGKELLVVPLTNVKVGPFPVSLGPIPRGVPVNLIMNIDPESENFVQAGAAMTVAIAEIRAKQLEGVAAYHEFVRLAGKPLVAASKCPDFELDRGHLFAESLSPEEQNDLIAFLKTL